MSADLHDTIARIFEHAQLGVPDEIHHLGHGELNNSYRVKVSGLDYCLRMAKYDSKGLAREADALRRLPFGIGPEVIYFSNDPGPIDKPWIIESFIDGSTPKRLNLKQFYSMGGKLAQTHTVPAPTTDVVSAGEVSTDKSQLWDYLAWCCRSFYPPSMILTNLPDIRLTRLAQKVKLWLDQQQDQLNFNVPKRLVHKDITPSNVLVVGDETFLIDWEIRDYGDPMVEFGTGFWDIELYDGKWRIVLTDEERDHLYAGYRDAGGTLNEAKIDVWTTFDKMGVAIFLCHRIHSPTEDTTPELQAHYHKDLEAIIHSLEQKF